VSLSSLNSHVFPYAHQMTQIAFCIDEKLQICKQKQVLPNFKHSQDEFDNHDQSMLNYKLQCKITKFIPESNENVIHFEVPHLRN
jgi:hypothetical protein